MIAKLRNVVQRVHRDDRGAMSIEKVLLIAVIVLPIVITLIAFRGKLMEMFKKKSEKAKIPSFKVDK